VLRREPAVSKRSAWEVAIRDLGGEAPPLAQGVFNAAPLDKELVEAFGRINIAHGQGNNFARELAKELAKIRITVTKLQRIMDVWTSP
jgi:hypothetical protein